MDIDRNGVVWAALASGHLASFDRRKCKGPLNGPKATGQQCPEGWTLYPEPLPQLKGVTASGSAESSYYTWVDQFDTFGLGSNVPINTGNESEGLLVLKDGAWIVLRVPYPLGYYTKWLDGRIDDPEGRLERPRAVVDGEHARAISHGDRQGHDEQGRALSAASGSAGEVSAELGRSSSAGLHETCLQVYRPTSAETIDEASHAGDCPKQNCHTKCSAPAARDARHDTCCETELKSRSACSTGR